MLFFLYGKNPQKIQEKIQNILKKGSYEEKIDIPEELATPQIFAESVCTPNLFGQKVLVMLTLDKSSDDEILKYIEITNNQAQNTDIIVVIPKDYAKNSRVLKGVMEKGPYVEFTEAKEDKDWTVFNFADTVFEKDREKSYKYLQELEAKEEAAGKMHSILVSHLRNLARIKFGANLNSPPFVKDKLRKQASKFSEGDILKMYNYFYELDKTIKTGEIPEKLINLVEVEKVFTENHKKDEKENIH